MITDSACMGKEWFLNAKAWKGCAAHRANAMIQSSMAREWLLSSKGKGKRFSLQWPGDGCSAQRAKANDSALIGKERFLGSKGQGQITQP